jgi:hypothetical protein
MSTESPKLEASKRKEATAEKQRPIHVIRDGGVAASIWQKTTGHGLTYLDSDKSIPRSPNSLALETNIEAMESMGENITKHENTLEENKTKIDDLAHDKE